MRKTSKFISLVTVLAMVLALFCVPALAADEDAAEVYTFDTVTVNEDGTVDGVEGEHLTMVVDGVETEMEPGTYEGDITITATPTFTLTTDVSTASDEADASASGESSGEINMSASGEASGETDASASGETEGSEESTGITRSLLGDEVVDTSGLDDYRTAIYVDGNGLSETYSVLAALQTGEADDEGASDITITATSDTFAGVVVKGAEYTVDNATIIQDTDSDGSQVNDANALGAAVIAYGSGTKLTISNSYIETTGVGKSALYIGGGADVIVKNSTLIANSGTLYDTYMSSANASGMLSSPWILGVDNARGNARTVSMVGAGSTETFVDSTVIAAGWGAMSTDMGSYLRMDVINTTVEAETGYAAFAISQIQETYYGSTLTSGSIGMIMMGGQADFTSYTGGNVITIKRMEASGEGKDSFYGAETDEVITEVVSEQVAEGETVTSSITTDGVGFEMHTMMGSDAVNGVTLRDGTSLETGEVAFVVKSGFGEVTVDDATITLNASKYTGETVFLQVMDNDDAFAGESAGTSFDEYFWEPAGWSFQFGTLDQDEWEDGQYDTMDYGTEGGSNYGQWTVTVDLTDTDIEGDMWNSSGYWNQGASLMQVSIGEGATVTGVISSGAYQHYAKTYEVGLYGYYEATGVDLEDNTWYNTYSGTWDNVDYISIVVNTPYYYGANGTEITITDGGVWNVTDTSFVTALSVDGGEINGVAGIYKVTVTVEDMDNQADTVTVASCEQVEWDGGDINIAAEDNTTLYVIVPEGSDIDDIIVVGESLGYAAEEYEAQYLGSFYVVGEGVLETPLDY